MKTEKRHWFLRRPIVPAIVLPLAGTVAVWLLTSLLAVFAARSLGAGPELLSVLPVLLNDILRILFALVIVLVIKHSWRQAFPFGLRRQGFFQSLLLASWGLLICALNIIQYSLAGFPLQSAFGGMALAVLSGLAPGIFEEIVCRGAVLTNCMIQWKEKPGCILRSLLVSSIIFGLCHLINLGQDIAPAILQVLYAAGIGVFFGAVYLRTRSLWGPMIIHTLVDFSAYLFVDSGPAEFNAVDLVSGIVIAIVYTAIGLFLVRPGKRDEIKRLWSCA